MTTAAFRIKTKEDKVFGTDFFPTPAGVIEKMIKPYMRRNPGLAGRTVLEPSAGKGDIANYINPPDRPLYAPSIPLDCIECDFDLAAILKENRHSIVGYDFLGFRPAKMYDLIVMNPPFSRGAEHLLHAWDILEGGDIVCLLNEETINNPCTKRRKLLAEIVAEHGEVEYLGACFDTAERKTGVRVAMVRLHKESEDKYRHMFEQAGMRHEERMNVEGPDMKNLPARRDLVSAIVTQYGEALDIYREMLALGAKLNATLKGVRGHDESGCPGEGYVTENLFDSSFSRGYNNFAEGLTRDAWQYVVNLAGLDQLMTARVRKEFSREIEGAKTLAFDKDNIFALIEGLMRNVEKIQRDALTEVFEYLTRYYDENREYVEGWKTNDRWKIKRKFILPQVVEFSFDRFSMSFYRNQEIRDIDRVLCALEGRKIENILTIEGALRQSFAGEDVGRAECEFFHLKYYKKGTVHFLFKDEALWERFCIEAAKGKEWLPYDYSYDKDGPIRAELEQAT